MKKIKIHKGKNHCNEIFPHILFTDSLRGSITFEGDFSYSIPNQEDTNKIIGFSDNWHHHMDSIRLGWRWNSNENSLEIMTILYSSKVRKISHLCFAETGKKYDFYLAAKSGTYVSIFDGNITFHNRSSKWVGPRYRLNPYFGGNTEAPKEFIFNFEFNK